MEVGDDTVVRHGASTVPLHRRDDRREPRARPRPAFPDHEALVVPFQERAAHLRRASTPRSTGWPGACWPPGSSQGDRVGIWSPNYAEWVLVQYATAKIGAILVNINPAYRTHEVRLRAAAVGLPAADRRHRVQDRDYGAMVAEVRAELPALERVIFLGTPDWDELLAGAATASPTTTSRDRGGRAQLRRPDQHPVHERHHRVPEGRHAVAPQHPQQRLLHRRGLPLHRAPTGSASPCPSTTASAWCSGNLGLHHPRRRDGGPRRRRSTPAPTLRTVAGRALHQSLYGVPTMFIAELGHPDFDRFDLSVAAHRDHGRLAVPGRGDEAGASTTCTWTR